MQRRNEARGAGFERSLIKKVLALALFILVTSVCINIYAKSSEESLDRIVAIVNDDVVTKSEFDRALSLAKIQLSQGNMGVPAKEVLHKQVLDQLINKKLQLQIAKQAGIHITDADIDRIVQNVAEKNNISVSELYKRINHDGMSTATYRTELHDQMTVQKLQQQEVGSRITVTADEITNYMHSTLWQNNSSKEYRLEDILIPLSDAPSSDEIADAKKRASGVVAKINQGQNFTEAAQKESGDDRALSGGDLGWRKLPEIPSAFAQYVTNMRAHEVAGPIQTPNGFHIIRLVDERATEAKGDAPNRTQVEQFLMQRKFEEHAQNWVSKMRSQAFITVNLKS